MLPREHCVELVLKLSSILGCLVGPSQQDQLLIQLASEIRKFHPCVKLKEGPYPREPQAMLKEVIIA